MGCKTTWVVVLGDFGRSPRMQYHALSLAQQVSTNPRINPCYNLRVCSRANHDVQAEQKVCVLAHQHSKPISDILADDRISLWAIRDT